MAPITLLEGRTAIISGSGLLPLHVALMLEEQGQSPFIVAIKNEADLALLQFEHIEISLVEFRKMILEMKRAHVRNIVLAGGVRSRPRIADLHLDVPTLLALPRFISAICRGDDILLRACISFLEAYDFKVVGAHEIVPDLLAPTGRITTALASIHERKTIALACQAARMIGILDVGQGVVAIGRRIVALEGAEGTDAMLARVADLRAVGRIPQRGGVLVKCSKPTQDERVDLAAIGLSTVQNAAIAGLSGIAIEAGRTFILGFKETVATANEKDIFIETFCLENM